MDQEELMAMATHKAAKELEQKSFEFLFQPKTLFDLLLRSDFEGTSQKFNEAVLENKVDSTTLVQGRRAIMVEQFYREVKAILATLPKKETEHGNQTSPL